MGTLSVFMSWIHRDRHLDWAARAGGTGEPRVAPSGAQTARQLPRCAGPRAAPPPPTAPLLSPALQVAEAGAVLAEGPRGLRTASSPQPGARSPRSVAPGARAEQVANAVGSMKCSLRRMLRPAEKKAPPGVAYRGVEDGVHDSRDSFQVPGRQRPGRRGPGGRGAG